MYNTSRLLSIVENLDSLVSVALAKDNALHACSFELFLAWADQIRFAYEEKTVIADSLLN